jgi:hypothetical protein
MGRNNISFKGPQPTAQDHADHRERMKLMQAAESRDRAEIAEIAAATQRGDHATAQALAVARYTRKKIGFAAQDERDRARREQ